MKLELSDIVILVDSREQSPLCLSPCQMKTATLATGDYSVKGLEDIISLERKELGDLINCMTTGRERFERELQRMKSYPVRCVVIEASWQDLEEGNYRSQLNPKSATHTVCSWIGRYNVPFQFCGTREYTEHFVQQFLFLTARRMIYRYQGIIESMDIKSIGCT